MHLEQQVCSLQLAKRLKELGVKQDSAFYWANYNQAQEAMFWFVCSAERLRNETWDHDKDLKLEIDDEYGNRMKYLDWYGITFASAFTVAELGEVLPKGIEYTMDEYPAKLWFLTCDWIGGKARCDYEADDGQRIMEWTPKPKQNEAATEADARAKMLIYLLENKLIPS